MAAVRGYRPQDLEACRRLWVELTQWHRDIYDSPEIGSEDPGRDFDEHLDKVGAQNIWVAEVDGHVVGLAGLIHGVVGEVEPVSVSKTHRDRGIGRLLVEAVIAAARERGCRKLIVRPAARNTDAIRSFHTLDFDVLGQLELGLDFVDRGRELWVPGERLADLDFRY